MQRAFSLVELSIVLVILGLLAGGVLAGQSLIRASELRGITSEYQRYLTAVSSFRDKYFALPGDMTNATSFWGKSAADCNAQTGTAATPGTCNGDGDGIITYPAAASVTGEAFRAWQHLALAGLVEGTYTGIAGSTRNSDHDYGSNSPQSRMANVGWSLTYFDNSAALAGNVFNYNYLNWLTVGISDNFFAENPFLRPEEAWNIDTKLDDGIAGQGIVHGWAGSGCSLGINTNRAAPYELVSTAIACPLILRML